MPNQIETDEPGRWIDTREGKRLLKADRTEAAKELFRQHEALLFHANTHRFGAETFTAADGRAYDLRETLRACDRELRQALDGRGPGLEAAQRDLPAIARALATT